MKNLIIAIIVIVLIGAGVYYFNHTGGGTTTVTVNTETGVPENTGTQATTTVEIKNETVIGTSVQGRAITAYHFGTGSDEVLFVGDIHGGYTPGTAQLAYQTMEYLKANNNVIPANVRVTVIPVLNPDGLNSTVGTTTGNFPASSIPTSLATQTAGRFNANNVDLNRNFDCEWQPSAQWQGRTVSGGTAAFSEPESQAIRAYIESKKPKAVVAWYAAEGGVYASACGGGSIAAETLALTNAYATASGYAAHNTYTSSAVPGDMTNWLAKVGVPAISVLLKTRTDSDWVNNQAGIKAVLSRYAR